MKCNLQLLYHLYVLLACNIFYYLITRIANEIDILPFSVLCGKLAPGLSLVLNINLDNIYIIIYHS